MPRLILSNRPLRLLWLSRKARPLPLSLNKDASYNNENTYKDLQRLKVTVTPCSLVVVHLTLRSKLLLPSSGGS